MMVWCAQLGGWGAGTPALAGFKETGSGVLVTAKKQVTS